MECALGLYLWLPGLFLSRLLGFFLMLHPDLLGSLHCFHTYCLSACRTSTVACDLCGYPGLHTQKSLVLGLILCCHHSELLNGTLNFYFVSELWWDNRACTRAEQIHTIWVSSLSSTPFSWSFHHEHKILVDLGTCGSSQRFKVNTSWSVFCLELRKLAWGGDANSHESPHLPFEPKLASNIEGSHILRNTNGQGTLPITSFLSQFISLQELTTCTKNDHREGKR